MTHNGHKCCYPEGATRGDAERILLDLGDRRLGRQEAIDKVKAMSLSTGRMEGPGELYLVGDTTAPVFRACVDGIITEDEYADIMESSSTT